MPGELLEWASDSGPALAKSCRSGHAELVGQLLFSSLLLRRPVSLGPLSGFARRLQSPVEAGSRHADAARGHASRTGVSAARRSKVQSKRARRLDGEAAARRSIQKHRNCTVAALSGQHTRFDGTLQALSEAQKRSQRNGLLPAAAMVQLSPLLGAARSSDGATQSMDLSCSQSSGKRSSMTTGLPFSKKQWVVMPLQASLPSTFIS